MTLRQHLRFLYPLALWAIATTACLVWFDWKLLVVIYLMLWANRAEQRL